MSEQRSGQEEQWEDSRQSGARVVGKMHSPKTYQDAEIHGKTPSLVQLDLSLLGALPDSIQSMRELWEKDTETPLTKDEKDELAIFEVVSRSVARHYLNVTMGTDGYRSDQGERMVGYIASKPPSLDEMDNGGKKGRSIRHPFGGR